MLYIKRYDGLCYVINLLWYVFDNLLPYGANIFLLLLQRELNMLANSYCIWYYIASYNSCYTNRYFMC